MSKNNKKSSASSEQLSLNDDTDVELKLKEQKNAPTSFWNLAVNAPLLDPLTYSYSLPVSEEMIGKRVSVPLGRGGRQSTAVVLSQNLNPSTEYKTKDISEIDQEAKAIPQSYLNWIQWLANYYHFPIGQIADLCFPPLGKKANKSKKKSPIPEAEQSFAPVLTEEQTKCIESICSKPSFGVHLLYGVTGSGKTEVYFQTIQRVIAQGKQVVVLVPEISLTPQLLHRFSARFGDCISVIHSQLTEREKTSQWWEMLNEEKKILVGARSALFCPLKNLGLIVVDEEHESSYKQDEKLKYHARDSAIVLAKELNIPIILGSATPSLETWKNAKEGKYQLHTMSKRVADRAMPDIHIIDLREKNSSAQHDLSTAFWMSPLLKEKLEDRLQKGQQSALFLNRRGMAQTISCPACGHVKECPNCAISLSLHARTHLICHYCDYHENFKIKCSECPDGELIALGLGTEKIEEDLRILFPQARLARADRDEVQSREQMEELVFSVERGDVDILIGTQMIAKGLDFPNLSLVSLVLADIGFNLPDFRASERSFQLITQVSGRAGRHQIPGEVLVQTYNPDHPSLIHALNKDYAAFAEKELEFRKELNYPPYGKLACFRVQALDVNKARACANNIAHRAQYLIEQNQSLSQLQVLGPVEAPIFKLRGKYRFHILIKSPEAKILGQLCRHLLTDKSLVISTCKLSLDIDPLQML